MYGNDYSSTVPMSSIPGAGIFAAMGIFFLLFAVVGIVIMVLWLLDLYDWGFRKEEEFPGGADEKKKWFFKFFLGVFAAPIAIIPILGALVVLVAYIAQAVFVFMYFFGVRKLPKSSNPKITSASTGYTPTGQDTNQQQPPVPPPAQ